MFDDICVFHRCSFCIVCICAALALVYTYTAARRGTMIGIDIDRAARKINIYGDRGAAQE